MPQNSQDSILQDGGDNGGPLSGPLQTRRPGPQLSCQTFCPDIWNEHTGSMAVTSHHCDVTPDLGYAAILTFTQQQEGQWHFYWGSTGWDADLSTSAHGLISAVMLSRTVTVRAGRCELSLQVAVHRMSLSDKCSIM